MLFRSTSSRRFNAYRRVLEARRQKAKTEPAAITRAGSIRSLKRTRGSGVLLRTFFELLGRRRLPILFALGTLTIATLLGLLPPAATKIAIDYAFTRTPLPPEAARFIPESWGVVDDPKRLLVAIGIGLVVLAAFFITVLSCTAGTLQTASLATLRANLYPPGGWATVSGSTPSTMLTFIYPCFEIGRAHV